jgi:hypothetical protein
MQKRNNRNALTAFLKSCGPIQAVNQIYNGKAFVQWALFAHTPVLDDIFGYYNSLSEYFQKI